MVEVRFPKASSEPVDALLTDVSRDPTDGRLKVGDDRVLEFLVRLSRRLLAPDAARRHPELGSLGFFLRRAELSRLVESLADRSSGRRRAPRGLVVHFPPTNVDTIFVYSWAMAALAGNHNVIRLSTRSGPAADAILDALRETAAEAHPAIAETQRIISYDRDDATTARLTAAAAVRVLWGGDRAVEELRRFPLGPLARDIAFPDRSSFAVISVCGWEAAGADRRAAAADAFANDVFWFDQAACSSPRAIVWVGDRDAATRARAEFAGFLDAAIERRGWHVDPAMAVEKRVATYGLAASGAATSISFRGNEVVDVELRGLADLPRTWLGAGTVAHVTVETLADLAPAIARKDQTLSQFGFDRDELDSFVDALAGRGIDRIVPFGQALTFADVWDGLDLLQEFTRIVTVKA
jgi:hypothetical protein